MNKNLEILEFHKILEMLANLSANEITQRKYAPSSPAPTWQRHGQSWKRPTMRSSCPSSSAHRRSTPFRICGWDCAGQSPGRDCR